METCLHDESRVIAQRRIVFPSPGWPPSAFPNGIVTYLANVRCLLGEFGYEPRILAVDDQPHADPGVVNLSGLLPKKPPLQIRIAQRLLSPVFPSTTISLGIGRDLSRALQHMRRDFPFDLIEMEETWGTAEYVRRALPVPIVLRLHGPWFLNGPAVGVPDDDDYLKRVTIEGRAIAAARAVTAPSLDVLERTRRFYDLPIDDGQVIAYPGPIVRDEDAWSPQTCNRNVILFVGRFDRHKGGDLMIDAFREVAKDDPEVELWFVGPDRGFVDDHGRRVDIHTYMQEHLPDTAMLSSVRVLGQKTASEISALRRQAAITVVASRYETFCIAALEALAHGCPLIAADAGGIPEMMIPGTTALTFQAGDFHDLAAKVRKLRGEPTLGLYMSEKARPDYEARFSPKVIAAQMASFYDRTLAAYR